MTDYRRGQYHTLNSSVIIHKHSSNFARFRPIARRTSQSTECINIKKLRTISVISLTKHSPIAPHTRSQARANTWPLYTALSSFEPRDFQDGKTERRRRQQGRAYAVSGGLRAPLDRCAGGLPPTSSRTHAPSPICQAWAIFSNPARRPADRGVDCRPPAHQSSPEFRPRQFFPPRA